jgi:VWFA-related protein
MSRSSPLPTLPPLLVGLLAILAPASAPPRAEEPAVEIVSPSRDAVVTQRITVRLELRGVPAESLRDVVVTLDGEQLGRLEAPPWVLSRDVVFSAEPRTVGVAVRRHDAPALRARRVTKAVPVDAAVDVRLVNVAVSVTDERGRPLTGLRREDFTLLDEGRRVPIERFSEGSEALSVMLVFDASESMRGDPLRLAKLAAERFAERLGEDDRLGLLVFNEELLVALSPSEDAGAAIRELRRHEARGGSALYDAVYQAAQILGAASYDRRRVVVLLSDGRDMAPVGWEPASHRTLEQARRRTHLDDVIIYAVGLGRNLERDPSVEEGLSVADVLRRLTRSTGGRLDHIERAEELSAAYERVLRELRHQYSLAFEPPAAGEGEQGWRSLEVRVDRRDVRVRARQGYYSR